MTAWKGFYMYRISKFNMDKIVHHISLFIFFLDKTIVKCIFTWLVFQPLEALWQLLADWLCLLRLEFNKDSDSSSANTSESTDSKNLKQLNQSHNDKEENSDSGDKVAVSVSEYIKGVDPRSCDQEGILKSLCVDQDVVGVILPRICGVIHAFYICCTCQHGHPQ